jgi:hypothetical protein
MGKREASDIDLGQPRQSGGDVPRTEEARQVVQEHIDDQRAIAEKLRRKMN